MLDKVDFPLTNAQISEFILNKGYTTYFKLQQALSELTEAELIREETSHNRTLYHLTEDGAQASHPMPLYTMAIPTTWRRCFAD